MKRVRKPAGSSAPLFEEVRSRSSSSSYSEDEVEGEIAKVGPEAIKHSLLTAG